MIMLKNLKEKNNSFKMEDEKEYYFVEHDFFDFREVFEQEILFYPHTFSDCFRELPNEKDDEKDDEMPKTPDEIEIKETKEIKEIKETKGMMLTTKFRITNQQIINFGKFDINEIKISKN